MAKLLYEQAIIITEQTAGIIIIIIIIRYYSALIGFSQNSTTHIRISKWTYTDNHSLTEENKIKQRGQTPRE